MDDDRRKDHNKGAVKHGTPDDDGSLNRRMFALRLVTLDYYLAAPSAPLDPLVSKLGGWEVWQVPVLRIFGVTPAGQKACLHVHGALPYLTVPCSESRPERFAVVLASEIDLLLNTAAGRATSMHRHVHHVAVFRGTRLYGFHDREETFLRIYLYNPLHVPKVAELLLSGHVLKQTMQPHEAHIPYALQFMVDHNLHGMSFVRVELFKFRRPLSWAHDDRSKALGSGPGIWSLRNLPVELFGDLEKQTTCELELDCCAKDILNANEKDVLSPGLAALWQEEEERRQEPVSWEPLSLEDDSFPPTESEQFYLARLDKLLTRPVMEEQDQTGFGKQPRKKHHSSLLDTSHGILDSQDEALAEALAQAASSWQRSGVEEEDSILGSLPTPDNVVDDEDDNDVEDMTQVFQLAGEREQDDADSSMSDHSDGNEAYDPFQLDGADDQPDCAVGVSKTAATTTRDQGTQTGARPPVLVRQLLGRARARRFTRLSLRRQQQQQHSQLRKQERSPMKRTGAEGPHRPGEAPGSSPPVAEDWQRWQSCCVASMLIEGGSTPSGGEPSQSPSLSIRSHESSSHLLDAIRPCSIQLSRLTEQEIVRWRHQQEPEGRRRWSLRDLNKPCHSGAAPDVSEPKRQRRKRGLSTESSASSQQSASAGGRRAAPVNSVLPHSEQFTNVEARSVEPAHRTRRVSYSSASEDGLVLHRHAKAETGKASKRVKVAAESSSSDRTLREREVGEKADKGRPAEAVANAGGDAESLDFCATAATADLGAELRVPSAKERVPHSRRERKLSSKRQLAVEVIESVPDSGASPSSSSSHLVNRSSDTEASVSRPSIICRIRIQGKHGVISTTSTRPRVVGFVSPDKSTTESRVADLGSPPTLSASESSSSTVVGAQMSDGSVPAATPLSSEVTNLGDSLKIKVSKRNKSSPATPEATETQSRSPERVYTSTELLATHLSPEVVDPVKVSRRKVSKKSRSNIVTPEAAVVQLENSEAVHASDASSLAMPSNSEVADSGVALRRPKRSRKGQASFATPEEPVVQSERTKTVCVVDSLESAATPSTSELADSGATLRTKLSRKSKSSDMIPESPAIQLENSQLAPVSDASAFLATHLSSELVDSGIVLRHPRKSESNIVTPEAPAVDIESAEASCASDAATALATSLSTEVADSDGVGLPKSSWKSKLRTAASDTCDGHLESCEAGSVPNNHESDPTTLSSEVTDHGASLRVKFSRRSSSSIAKPETPAEQPKSSGAAHMSNAPDPVATPLRSDTEDSGVLSRPKRSRKSKYGTVTAEAAGTHLESSQVGRVPDSVTSFSAPSSAEGANTGTVSRLKSSRKSKLSITTPETLLESSQANAMPDVATSLAIPMSSEVADSSAKLRTRSSRKSKSNMVTPETPETHLDSFKPMLSDAPPTAVEPKASEAATCGLPSRRNTRSASDVGPKRTRLASTCSSGKPAKFPEPVRSGPASIGNMHDHQLVPVMGAQDATLGTSQSSSDVDAIQEPENVVSVSRPGRRRRIVSLCSSSDSQDATNIPSDDSTARPGNEVRATTRRTRRQVASTKLSLRDVSATRSSSAESVTSTSSCEVLSGGLTEMSLPKQEILSKQASGVEEKSSSKVAVRRSRSRGNSASASLSCSTESTNTVELGTTSTVQGGAQTVKSKEVRSRSSSRIFANKLALRSKVRKEDNEGKPGAPELQNSNCLVADTSDNSPALDVGVASKATTGAATSNVSPFDSASCSTGASFANLVSNCTTTGLVSSGLQVTSSSMPEGIPKPGVPEAVGPHERPVLGAPRLGTPSSKREVGGLPIRSSKSRKKAVLPEAPDPRIQELLVTCERLTITTPGELSVDDSVGSKQPDVAQPSTSLNLPEAAGSVDPPPKSSPSRGSDSVQNEGHQRYESNREPGAEHLKGPSNSGNLVDTRECDNLKSGASSSTGGAAGAGDLTKGAPKGVENRPDSILEPEPVPNCALSEPGTTDSDTLSSHLSTAGKGLVAARELLHPKQRQCDVTDSDALPASSDIPLSDVTMIEANIELEAPQEVNVCSAVSCDLAAANASTNANLDAGRNGPTPVESVQENSSVISVGKAELSELTAKPGVSDVAHTNAPADELLSSNTNKLPTTSHSSPLSTSSKARREPPTSPMGNCFDSSGLSPISTAVEHCRPHVTSPIEQSSSQILDGHQAVSECSAADLVTELNVSIESGQKATEDCTEKATDSIGTPEPVSVPCGQKENKPSTASSDDVQLEAESSSCICADTEQAAASQESGVDTNSAEVSSADDDFICLSPDGDDEWILLDEVRDDSVELFPSPKGSIAADSDESCGDDTVVKNIASASDVNRVDIGVCQKVTTVDNIGDVGGTGKDVVGHLSGASSENGVRYEGSFADSVENSGKESRSKKSVGSVFRESSSDNCDPNCGSHDENANSIDGATSVTGDECVVYGGGESCPEAASSMENFEISNETLANNSCDEILRNFGSDSSMIDVGSENFLDPGDGDECTEKMAKGDCADITSADFVQDFGSENCVGDIGSEGVEFIASENFIEDIGSEESMELFSGTESESKQHKKEAVVGEISSDARQHEDTCAMVAAAKSVQVVVERLDDIDPRSAIGMLYCKAKKALKYNRAPCKVAKIAENKHEGKPDNSQAEQAGTEKKGKTVGRPTARKSPVSHRKTLRPSKALHKDVRAPSSQTAPKDSQVLHQSPREQDSSVQPVSAEKAPTFNQKTFKSSKTSHKGLLASGNQLSSGDSQAQHAKAQEQDGSVAPFSEDKSSSVKQASKSSKSLQKDHRDARNQHFEKSADESKAKPTGPRKKDVSGNRLSVDKSSNSHQNAAKASKSSSQDVKVAKNKDSDATTRKPEALRAVVKKPEVRVAHSSLERSLSCDQEALKSSKTSHRAFKVAKNKDSAASASKADAQQPNTEKLADTVDCSSVDESPSHDQKASKSSKTSYRAFKVAKNKDSATSVGKAQAQQLSTEKQGDGADRSSAQELPCHDQAALRSSKTSHRAFKVTKNKDSAASASKAAQRPGIDKQRDIVNSSSVGESPSHDQEASKTSKTSHQAFKVAKNKDSVARLGKAQAQQLSTEKQGDSADHSSAQELPCHDQAASESSKTSHRAFKVTKNKDSAASASKAEAQRPGIDKLRDIVNSSSVGESLSHDQEASKSSKTSHHAFNVAKNKDSAASFGKAQAQQLSTEKQGDSADHSSAQELPCHDQAASKSSKTSHRAFKVTKNKNSAASASKAEAQRPVIDKQRDIVDSSSVGESPSHDQEASKSSKTSHQAFKVANNDTAASLSKSQAQQLSTEKQGDSADHSSVQELPCHDLVASKSSKISCQDVNVDKTKDSPASPNKAEAQQAVMEKQGDSVDPFLFDRSQSHDEESLKSPKTFCQDFEAAENKGSHTSPNKTEAHQEVTEKQGDDADPFSLEKSSSPDQQVSRSPSHHFNKDIRTCGDEVPVCVKGEPGPDNLEDQKAGGDVQQQNECVEPLQIARSETLPPTDMGKVPGLLDQVLDLGELPDAIKCLLDSEVPLPELDADCFSLPPDSTRWLSEDGVVEKRKPDEHPQNGKEDSTPFCPSSDIELGDLTKACSLTNEGLVALVPAVPPPTCGPYFNSSSTPRARKKCLRGLTHWQKTKLEAFARDSCFEVDFEHNPELRIAFCRDRSVVLTPARSAPMVSLLAPTLQRPPPSPDDDVVSIRELPASDASTDPAMLLVSPPSTPPRHETSTSQLDGPTGRFALSGARLPADTERVLTVLSVEVHVRTRSDLRPDPEYDPVQCVLWCARGYGVDAPLEAGAMHWCSVGDPRQVDIEDIAGTSLHRAGVATPSLRTQVVRSELDLLHAVVDLVHRWDPDVLLGYDVERASWGYLCDRAEHLDLDLYARLSRAPPPPGRKDILGRILLCAWRILRKEVALNIYTFENTYYHVMHRRVPLYSFRLLSEWFSKDLFRWRTVEHYALRARGNLELLDELNVFGKTSQMARIFGIQFYEVLSRGSQFRVESMLLRLARSHRMVALSASTAQRARQRAPEFIPLVLEPRAQLYTDPVVVLDFQSLYPSVIISHNYCFSTCLGRVENLGSSAPFGCSSLEVPLQYVKSLRDHITVSPAGVAFVKPSIRRGLLPQMLDEVLGTRIMVKKAMSQCTNKGLYRMLDAQQLSLKLISNVTYGYTAAGFSGRMPCVEVADSVVSKGREALEQAIRTAEATVPGARVVYGDTDSLFVLLEGRSREEAFRLGQEIADRVTAQNPRPMRLKLEKVYQPCVLQTKKRYVGFSYESPDQQEPKYDAKGIETVRRDTCPAVAKLLEKMLRVLFTSRDMVPVKRFVKLQFSKILAERVSPQDFIFAREFRGLHGYQPSACVPALEITRRQLRRDPRAEPLVGERVPYVVVYGHPGQRLIELVRSPLELLSGQLRINAHYYVARVIGPALNRVLRLLGADCLQWYEELPRPRFVSTPRPGTMAAYVVVNQLCLACGGQAESRQLCASCEADPGYAALILGGKVQRVQKALLELQTVCHSCMGFQAGSVCLSIDCPVLFKTSRVTTEAQQALEWNRARNSVPASSS